MTGSIGQPTAASRVGRGTASPLPQQPYEPPAAVTGSDRVAVEFVGEDGRRRTFRFAALPLAAWHADLAVAFARRVGPTGGLRTESSATGTWTRLGQLLRFLDTLAEPPSDPTELRPSHLTRFRLHLRASCAENTVQNTLHLIRLLLAEVRPMDRLSPDLVEFLGRRGHLTGRWAQQTGVAGYSDREFAAVLRAARGDVAAIIDRFSRAEALLTLAAETPEDIPPDQRDRVALLSAMADTGVVPEVLSRNGRADQTGRHRLARELFLLDTDLPALLVLGVALTGRNGETIKELPAAHRIIEDRAVAVALIKRRRGKAQSRFTVHWEIGSQSRRLHTPGGFYLLLHSLARRGRAFSGTDSVWAVWATEEHGGPDKVATNGHIDPFAKRLGRNVELYRWVHRHQLLDDGDPPQPLVLTLNRIKTSVEVRMTRAVGGHLPSAIRTNTMDVSFAHYLRNDPRVRDWADQILTEALGDAETAARAARLRIVDTATRQRFSADPAGTALDLQSDPDTVNQALRGDLDTLFGSCLDIEHPPHGGGSCTVSFLTCLRCPNALIAERHLPMLLALRDLLQARLDSTEVDAWCAKYGPTWLILTRRILPRFTQAQQIRAAQTKPATTALDLLDGPTELS